MDSETAEEKAVTTVCDNCGKECQAEELKPLGEVTNLRERLDPGAMIPHGECRDCGCFCYAKEEPEVPQPSGIICQVCRKAWQEGDLLELEDHKLIEALQTPGAVWPWGQCPECAGFCYDTIPLSFFIHLEGGCLRELSCSRAITPTPSVVVWDGDDDGSDILDQAKRHAVGSPELIALAQDATPENSEASQKAYEELAALVDEKFDDISCEHWYVLR